MTHAGFAKFVASQPMDRVIDHWDGYRGCAIGAYFSEVTGIAVNDIRLADDDTLSEFAQSLPPIVFKQLSTGGYHDHLRTYGGLNNFLQLNGVIADGQ